MISKQFPSIDLLMCILTPSHSDIHPVFSCWPPHRRDEEVGYQSKVAITETTSHETIKSNNLVHYKLFKLKIVAGNLIKQLPPAEEVVYK